MLRFLCRLLIVLTLMDAAFNSLWIAYAHTPLSPMYTALVLAFVLALLLKPMDRAAQAWRTV
jgi:hypothetical protein